MITSESIQTVINNLAKVLPMAKRDKQLDMANPFVCGTTHCHGGWYAVATIKKRRGIGFRDGADRMAKDLGFDGKWDLERWAKRNKKVWGNSDGGVMFYNPTAFTPGTKRYASNLQDIYDHWCEVQIRLKLVELENESNN